MNSQAVQPGKGGEGVTPPVQPERRTRQGPPAALSVRWQALGGKEQGPGQQAELFYLQKQIQSQTPMVIVLHDGERIEGCIEWYDSIALKVRGRGRTLIYKSAIKYMYKLSEVVR
jgi:sRNA-binding regulator protein Hfq